MAEHAEDTTVGNSSVAGSNIDQKDKDFVMEAASGEMMEVELGKMAQQNQAMQG